jgi:hypothetical protein
MSENDIETTSVRQPSWRDNKAVLWLVRIGFLLQFYIPAAVCCYIVYETGTRPPFTMSEDDPYYADHAFGEHLSEEFFKFGVYTLILLFVQWTIFALILRFAKLRSVEGILWCLIVINIIHAFAWIFVLWPVTLIRLTPPTVLYYIAITIETRRSRHAPQEPAPTDSP